MKKINSNSYGGKIICIGLIPLIVIAGILWAANQYYRLKVLSILMYISIGVGLLIEISFFVYLLIESYQDKKIEKYYEANPDSEKTPQDIIDGK